MSARAQVNDTQQDPVSGRESATAQQPLIEPERANGTQPELEEEPGQEPQSEPSPGGPELAQSNERNSARAEQTWWRQASLVER